MRDRMRVGAGAAGFAGALVALVFMAAAGAQDAGGPVVAAETLLQRLCLYDRGTLASAAVREAAVAKLAELAPGTEFVQPPGFQDEVTLRGQSELLAKSNPGITGEQLIAGAQWLGTDDGMRIAAATCDGLLRFLKAGPAADAKPVSTPQRRDLLRRVAVSSIYAEAIAKQAHAVDVAIGMVRNYELLKADSTAMDQASDAIMQGPRSDQIPSTLVDAVADQMLAPAWIGIADSDLERYAQYLESTEFRTVAPVLGLQPAFIVAKGSRLANAPLWSALDKPTTGGDLQAQAQLAARQRLARVEMIEAALDDPDGGNEARYYGLLQQDVASFPDEARLQRVFGRVALRASQAPMDPSRRLITVNEAYFLPGVAALERAMALEPENGQGVQLLGYARFLQQRFDEAQKLYDRAAELGYREPRALMDRSDLLFEQGKRDAALQLALDALAAEPWSRSNSVAFYALSFAHATPANLDRIAAAFDRYLAGPDSTAVERGWYAEMLMRVGADYARARAVFETQGGPRSGYEHRLHAQALVMEAATQHQSPDGMVDAKGQALLEQAREADPDTLSVASALLGRPQTAPGVVVMARTGMLPDDLVNGEPLLLWAIAGRNFEVAAQLIDAGLDVNRTGQSGATAIHLAVARRQPQLVKSLLAHGADCCRPDGGGRRPLDLLANDPSPEAAAIRQLLQAAQSGTD